MALWPPECGLEEQGMGGPADRQPRCLSPSPLSSCLLGTQLTSWPWKCSCRHLLGQGGPLPVVQVRAQPQAFLASSLPLFSWALEVGPGHPREPLRTRGFVQRPWLQARERQGGQRRGCRPCAKRRGPELSKATAGFLHQPLL